MTNVVKLPNAITPQPFKMGDTVALNSGGARMTVESVTPAKGKVPAVVLTAWTDAADGLQSGRFFAPMLQNLDEEEDGGEPEEAAND